MKSKNWIILRSPMIFDKNSPRIKDIINKSEESIAIEIFPNLIVNINSAKIFAKQIHYIISRNISGIIHHGSNDLVNHDEYIFSIVKKLKLKTIKYKYVYTTNENRYLALFSNRDIFPSHLQFSYSKTLKI
jgi:dTDP-4-dehydrorhamnose reductase